ncbi:MAG: ATP-dependent DNA helicase RecG [Gammaproteobacteria bacterium]|nr:ATP-dependent DNA helicase RecG [Gammaproteobacteria bacterium]MCW5583187.1 ATP-dependent DNA helicase RecG [Gammaproteobacteria bacterium]
MTSAFQFHGIGKQSAKHLARLEIFSVQDLLFHLPSRYQDRTRIEFIRQLIPGNEAVIEGTIHQISTLQRGRTKLLCELKDETGIIHLRFFHVLTFQSKILQPGTRLRCYSEVRMGPKGLEMVHPEFQVIRKDKPLPLDQHLTPIYPTTEGLTQYAIRKLTTNALAWMRNENTLHELLPEPLLQLLSYPTLKDALQFVHRPPRQVLITNLLDNKTVAQQRLVFEELLAHRISLLQVKYKFQSQMGVSLAKHEKLSQQFRACLLFQLTHAQERVIQEIQHDLILSHPMLRLVQGDVGSGKTVVAAFAMLQSVENGHQAAMMAPTELLAEQHYRVFHRWFEPLGVKVVFLSGNVKARARSAVLEAIKSGDAQIILGTHALFQQEVSFTSLALVIIDEQHRFGVQQRALFRAKGMQLSYFPHQLIMTATPIPRTLAMSFYADLDCSTINELPPGRMPIMTSVLANSRREEVVTRIRKACQQGRQVYWVCPLIDESEAIVCQAATKTMEELQKLLPEFKIGMVHGRMHSNHKESAMRAFQAGEIHLLVATTVIEVGVDVPNASVMIIENAERLGLSQLHQLRGRVGRGLTASHCVLLYQYPLSELAKARLAVMRETTDGFKIAQYDLELRGPGEILGTKQTGDLSFRIADLIRDSDILPQVHKIADLIMRDHKEVIPPLIERWLGNKEEYGKV